jgi:hypothetical protein
MVPISKDPLERANAIKKLEAKWVLKSKEKKTPSATNSSKKTRTSLTNPIIKNNSVNGQNAKN